MDGNGDVDLDEEKFHQEQKPLSVEIRLLSKVCFRTLQVAVVLAEALCLP